MIFPRATCLAKMTHHRLRYKKHALEIDVQHGVEVCFRNVPKVVAFFKAGVVDEYVDLSHRCDYAVISAINRWPSAMIPTSA